MVISLVYAMLAMASVLNFGLLPDFIVDYLVSFLNENNAKILMYYDNWCYFRLYWITFIQKLSIRIAEQIRGTTGKATDVAA